ncbi:glycoside hydrolase family 9 protein [Paenibacillus vini]|uniref:glycoside hydrolase family 9 protein n=1 Tax=Paenibacillus vini TaxID=1476024 RepID=UPI0025B6B49E|nr:glycoside hydrolase family 9 protein [Paenibacillus vini]MDN4068472.1 glycoside hydrolase family 9 protein [Paenibacillus vini]
MGKWFRKSSALSFSILLALTSYSGWSSLPGKASAAASDYNYAEALQKSIYFYETQRSGELPDNNRVEWRGDSGMQDGADVGHDLTGGWYDAGDHVKFGFPMASTATLLAWSVYEYRDGYEQSGQLDEILDNIRWATDYFMKAHTAPNELWGQVGNGTADHNWWGPAEVMPMQRPAYKIDAAHPGSDLAGETAAALAAASIIFKDSDPSYSAELLRHAKELYSFADQYRGKYSDSITDATQFYNSWSGYADELSWGAVWLYLATQDQNYLDKAIAASDLWGTNQQGQWDYKWTHAWDDKHYGAQLLLARITGDPRFVQSTERNMEFWTTGVSGTGEKVSYTPGGLAHLDQWGALRYSANQAFLAFVYSDWVSDAAKKINARSFAEQQILYMLGDNPRNSSYVIGFGDNSPQHPHHRTSHGSWADSQSVPANHRHVLYGALVGGPSKTDAYTDSIGDYVSNEVATDYNAGFTGALAKMMLLHGAGQQPLSSFPAPETREDEMFVEASVNASGSNFIEIRALLNNRSGWPARASENMSFKYYLDLSEAVAAGYGPEDITVTAGGYNQGATVSQLQPHDEANHIYYTNVDFTGTRIYPGGQSAYRKEVQFRIAGPLNTNFWDNSNDFSYQGIGTNSAGPVKSANIPVFDAGVRVFGEIPPGGGNPGEPQVPAAPKGVKATPGSGKVDLFWNAVSGAADYVIQRSEASGGPYTTVGSVTGTSFSDSGLSNGTTYFYVVTARNQVGSSLPSAQVSATPREIPIPAEGDLKVQYRTNDTNAGDNQIRAQFKIVNTGDEDISLSNVKLRYYYTIDGDKAQQFHCDYAAIGSGNVSGSFVKLDSPLPGADYYLEISFGPSAGTLAPGADTGEIQIRFNKTDWTNFSEGDDYSYDGTRQSYAEWDKTPLYMNGTLVWGAEP